MSDINKSNREHSFDFELAKIVGLEKAILLKNISYWTSENKRRNQRQYFHHEKWWTEESLSSLAEKYPYMKRASIGRWMQELHDQGWICMIGSSGSRNKYSPGKVFDLWNADGDWQSELSQNETVKNHPKMRQSASQNETVSVPEWDGKRPKMRHNNIDSNVEGDVEVNVESSAADAPVVEPPVEEEKKKKKVAPGPGAAPSWTKVAATIFDEVGAELSKAEGIDYIPFNWKVCNDQNFAHLKNLRKLAIEPDFKNKIGHEPNDEEFFASFRAVMTLSFKYFRKIQKETNGALHYTPSSIYSSYNKIKNFKNGTSNNGSIGGQPSKFGQGCNQNGKFDPAKGY